MITKLDDELPCVIPNSVSTHPVALYIVVFTIVILAVIVNGYIFAVHLMFKELRKVFGKLLMLHSLFTVCSSVGFLAKVIMLQSQTGRQLIACFLLSICEVAVSAGTDDVTATCMLHCLAYILYRSFKLQRISKEDSKSWYRYYIACILGSMALVLFLMISYDVGIDQGAHILPNGDCSVGDVLFGHVKSISLVINKSAQVLFFLAYLYFKYQLNKDVQNPALLKSQDKLLHQIAITLGATIGSVLELRVYGGIRSIPC